MSIKYLQLSQGKQSTIDSDCNLEFIHRKWTLNSMGYAYRWDRSQGKPYKCLLLHRYIMGLDSGDKRIVDHIDGDKLNNTKSNLQIVDMSINIAKAKLRNTNTSGYRGVGFLAKTGKWQAGIMVNYKKKHLGNYVRKEDAARAYNGAALYYFGKQAVLNTIDVSECDLISLELSDDK